MTHPAQKLFLIIECQRAAHHWESASQITALCSFQSLSLMSQRAKENQKLYFSQRVKTRDQMQAIQHGVHCCSGSWMRKLHQSQFCHHVSIKNLISLCSTVYQQLFLGVCCSILFYCTICLFCFKFSSVQFALNENSIDFALQHCRTHHIQATSLETGKLTWGSLSDFMQLGFKDVYILGLIFLRCFHSLGLKWMYSTEIHLVVWIIANWIEMWEVPQGSVLRPLLFSVYMFHLTQI